MLPPLAVQVQVVRVEPRRGLQSFEIRHGQLPAAQGDAAVLDIKLRGEIAFAIADALRKRGVPFVFATGYDRGVVPDEHAAVPLWVKPFDPEVFARALPGLVQAG